MVERTILAHSNKDDPLEVSIIKLSGDERYHVTDNYRDKEQQPSIWLLCGFVPDTSRIGFHIEAGIYGILVEPAWTTQRGGLRMHFPFPFRSVLVSESNKREVRISRKFRCNQ